MAKFNLLNGGCDHDKMKEKKLNFDEFYAYSTKEIIELGWE